MKSIDKTGSRADKYGNWKNEKNNIHTRCFKHIKTCGRYEYIGRAKPINDFPQLTRRAHTHAYPLYFDMHAIRESEGKQEEKGITIIAKHTYTRTHM